MKTLTYRHCPGQFACFLSSQLSHLIQTKMNTANVRDMYEKETTKRNIKLNVDLEIPNMFTFSLLI